jgi:hypothetical protein
LEITMQLVQVKIKGVVSTSRYGTLQDGDILRTDAAFAQHLVDECGAGEIIGPVDADQQPAPPAAVARAPRKKKAAAPAAAGAAAPADQADQPEQPAQPELGEEADAEADPAAAAPAAPDAA